MRLICNAKTNNEVKQYCLHLWVNQWIFQTFCPRAECSVCVLIKLKKFWANKIEVEHLIRITTIGPLVNGLSMFGCELYTPAYYTVHIRRAYASKCGSLQSCAALPIVCFHLNQVNLLGLDMDCHNNRIAGRVSVQSSVVVTVATGRRPGVNSLMVWGFRPVLLTWFWWRDSLSGRSCDSSAIPLYSGPAPPPSRIQLETFSSLF